MTNCICHIYIAAAQISNSKNNHDTVQPGRRKQVRTEILFLFLKVPQHTRCPWNKISSLYRENFKGNSHEADSEATEENDANMRMIVNPYKCNNPHNKQSCNMPFLNVRNPYNKPSSQQRTETNHLAMMTHSSRVSTYAFH